MSTPGTRLVRRDEPALDVTPKPKRAKRLVVAEVRPFNIFAVARLDAARHFGKPLSVAWDGTTLRVFVEEER